MPRYLSQHTLACLTRQGAETLAQRMQGGGPARLEANASWSTWSKKEKCLPSSDRIRERPSKRGSKPKACILIGSFALNGRRRDGKLEIAE